MDEDAKIERTTVWIDKELVRMAKTIAGTEGDEQTAARVVEQELRGPITRRYRRVIQKLNSELGGEAGGA